MKTKTNKAISVIRQCCIEARDECIEVKAMLDKSEDKYWGAQYERCLNKKMDYEDLYKRVTGKEINYGN